MKAKLAERRKEEKMRQREEAKARREEEEEAARSIQALYRGKGARLEVRGTTRRGVSRRGAAWRGARTARESAWRLAARSAGMS